MTEDKNAHSAARRWGILIVGAIVVLIAYFVVLDRYTPMTNDAYIQAYVVQISPQVAGTVTKVHVQDNAFVQSGDPLFVIDSKPYAYKVNQLAAERIIAIQQVAEYQTELDAAKAALEQSKADSLYASQRFKEIGSLNATGYAAEQQLENITDQVSDKKAAIRKAEAQLDKLKAQLAARIGDEHALIHSAEAQLDKARYDLEQTTVYAPVDGYVTNQQLIEGAYIDVGQAAMTLVDTSRWWVIANFRENSLEKISSGQSARIQLGIFPGRLFKAKVESVGWGVSAGQGVPSGNLPEVENPQDWLKLSQRFPVRLRLDKDSDASLPLRVGASATVLVYTSNNVLLNGLATVWIWVAAMLDYLY
jgi:multidrug resistance efflux pump